MEAMLGSGMGMCRCCATEGTFKGLTTSFLWMGEQEIYLEMLRDCLDVTLEIPEEGPECGICEVCITQLRSAVNFKRQVLNTERQFQRMLENNAFPPKLVKEELSMEADEDDIPLSHLSDDDHAQSEGFSSPEYDVAIKAEKADEKKPRKRAKPGSSRGKLADAEPPAKRKSGGKKRKQKIKEEAAFEVDKVDKIAHREKHLPEMKKQWHNLTTLLKHSNATPFKDRNDAGYICAYCFHTFPDPNVLRSHTQNDHVREKPTYKAGSGMASFVAFLDIVDLKCTVCDHPFESINSLAEHLVKDHDKKYYLGTTDYFQPFKLSNEQQINCCLCNEVFHNMKLLMQHMNIHYRNFICTTCGAGFVNSFRLNRHETTHGKKKSSFPCRHCGQVFAAESKRKAHVNTEHKGIAGDSVCQICKSRFKNYYQKTRHMMQVHNAEGIKCDMCEKKFNLKSNLMLHMRGVHLKERPYECSVCSMGFFIKRHMLGHYMATHTNERKYKCDICGKAYATQNSRGKHMKKNHGISKSTMMAQNLPKCNP